MPERQPIWERKLTETLGRVVAGRGSGRPHPGCTTGVGLLTAWSCFLSGLWSRGSRPWLNWVGGGCGGVPSRCQRPSGRGGRGAAPCFPVNLHGRGGVLPVLLRQFIFPEGSTPAPRGGSFPVVRPRVPRVLSWILRPRGGGRISSWFPAPGRLAVVPPPRVGGHPPRAPGAPGSPPLSGSTWPLLGAPSPAVPPAARRSATRVAIAAGNSSRSPAAHLSLSVLQLLWVEELKVGRLRIPVFWGENPHPLG